MARLAALAVIVALMGLALFAFGDTAIFADARSTMTFGFLLLAAYLIGDVLSRFRLPKITGYILAGILFGPHLLDLVDTDTVQQLKLIDDLALTFIAFAAGGELRLDGLRERRRSITLTVLCQAVIVFLGVAAFVLAAQSLLPFLAGKPSGPCRRLSTRIWNISAACRNGFSDSRCVMRSPRQEASPKKAW